MKAQKPLYIAYYRVSTKEQGKSGLGLAAQKEAVNRFTQNCTDCILAEFTEVETGTKKKNRPKFEQAKNLAIEKGAILLIAKLDRLSRNVHFISGLMESKVKFNALDMPEADNFTVHIFAALAEREAKLISERTKAALDARRKKFGEYDRKHSLTAEATKKGHQTVRQRAEANENNQRATGYIELLKDKGLTFRAIATKLNGEGFKTSKGKAFQATTVMRLYKKAITAN